MKTKKISRTSHKKKKATLLSQRAYAKKKGLTPQAISKAVRQGRITLVRGKIHPRQADAELRRNRDPARDPFRKGPGRPPKGAVTRGKKTTLLQARLDKEFYQAQIARLDYEARLGQLVDRNLSDQVAFDCARQVRDRLLSIPGRISAMLVVETSAFKIEQTLGGEIRQALEALVRENEPNTN